MKFVLASQNKHKLEEMQAILSAHGVEAVLQSDLGLHVDVEETGSTFAANAMLKAKAVMEASGLPAIADDSGVCCDALSGAPGVYSARYGGPELDDAGRYRLLLANMQGAKTRAAHFTSAIACIFPNGDTIEAEGICPGTIAFAPQGTGGFGYDPVFFLPELRKTYAQLTPEEKAAVSHRGKALAVFDGKLRDYLQGGGYGTDQ
jgi:XTP/dITP diphosphohydrolase